MFNAVKKMWKNGFNFGGRSSVGDYWYVVLFNFLLNILLYVLVFASGTIDESGTLATIISLAFSFYTFLAIIPSIALFTRRLHDSNHSFAWYFISLVPFIGGIVLLVLLCSGPVDQNNRYGARV